MVRKKKFKPYKGPAGGWGSIKSVTRHMAKQKLLPSAVPELVQQNKPDGFMCVSCAWAKPEPSHPAEFCENGAKATFAEITKKRTTPDFFSAHTITDLRTWSDHDLEDQGRITHPMRFNRETDCYEPVTWGEAIAGIAAELEDIRSRDPERVVFYASGRASLETSYMYQLFARIYGNNNLPDSSNMCHETTSVALPEVIGVPVGTVRLEDFDDVDMILSFGQNVGSNSPRMLHQLKDATERGATIVTFNPLRERGWERFVDPQNPAHMLSSGETRISTLYHQVRAGGDIAAIAGIAKALLSFDDDACANGTARVLDTAFIGEHTSGFSKIEEFLRAQTWVDLERESGLTRKDLEVVAKIYGRARNTIAIYGMGLTQHKLGVDTVQMLVNLLLLKGNIGRRGSGICPVRGHSNVQGQRTVGIAEKPELAPLDQLEKQYGFEAPRKEGLNTIKACQGIVAGSVDAFVGLGGNFLRAVPDRDQMEAHWPNMQLTVQIATKLNRSHLFNGRAAYLLPCLGRIEIDRQQGDEQIVTMEDSTAVFHKSKGMREPASPGLRSEPWIVAQIAKATIGSDASIDWDGWVNDYATIRDAMETTWPEMFADFNERIKKPGGFARPIPARERIWKTETGKANFKTPRALQASFDDGEDDTILRLITLRSNDQFNTTVYGYRDRFRGIYGTRMVVLVNKSDIKRFGLKENDVVSLVTVADDGIHRRMDGFTVLSYDIPQGCIGAYYPEANALIPLYQHAQDSFTPAAKSVPVRIVPQDIAAAAQ
ncbi:FdhF/YdeP family oxidoreductase [Pelagibacterium luteolum]|uniref:Oxidoreductase alpha (Molybdopterin) subunit n=1 Tax=Pelagibacterium luteolum TaxID=440168 RepID=A0A1G8A688_9HYPH|nr:FdhF/YdeP family oxidoreductase [Pelagibacterium luteolum]SDH16393.1 oxidoreductase alpha (molybdopterin) subunit [Pelagibacterium luteolum]